MKMQTKGLLVVVSAPSGCGKDTVLSQLLQQSDPEKLRKSLSATTRGIRQGVEKDGVDYSFVTAQAFKAMIENGELLEYAQYCDNFYGTPAKPVEDWRSQGIDVLLKIEVQGAKQIKKLVPDCVSIFILPPSLGELRRRLAGRGTDTPQQIEKRMAAAIEEMQHAKDYDYLIYNDTVSGAVRDIQTIISAEKFRYSRDEQAIERMLQNA